MGRVLGTVCSTLERKQAQHDEDRDLCVICLDAKRCMAAIPCGHVSVCANCADDLRGANSTCVVCFANVDAMFKIFL